MMKVRVQRVGTQIAALGGMAAAASAVGCTDVDSEAAAPVEDGQENVQETAAPFFGGRITFDLAGWPGAAQSIEFVIAEATTDEFLRVGQVLKFDLPALTLWDWVHPGAPLPSMQQLQQLEATIEISALDESKPFATSKVGLEAWAGSDVFTLRAITGTTVIPAKTDLVRFAMTITDPASATSVQLGPDDFASPPVFGGELPGKSLLFDSTPSFRQRVVEGDDPVAGASLLFGYTDYRADTLVDASTIDRQIGTQLSAGRFGQVIVPIYGTLEHQVSYGVFFDDGKGWQPEAMLAANTDSRFVGAGRTVYESAIAVPAKAGRMSLYVHVKTFLVATYPPQANLTKWYADGEKIAKAEKYDNPGGQALVNYDFSIENK